MVEHRTEKEATGESQIDEEQVCAEVLGYKYGYIRGRGAGPKPSRSVAKHMYREELEEAKRNAKNAQERAGKAEQQVLVFSEQLENQKSVIEQLKEGLVATQRAMLESQKNTSEMMAFFQKIRQTSHISTSPHRIPTRTMYDQQSIHSSAHGFASQNTRKPNNEFDAFEGAPELRELLREVARY